MAAAQFTADIAEPRKMPKMIPRKRLNILIGCEFSGVVREAFAKRGHNAWSCDLLPADDKSEFHLKGDIFEWLDREWDMAIFHPPCTFVCGSGMHWTTRGLRPQKLTDDAIRFAEKLWLCKIRKVVIENPVGILSTRSKLGKPTQYIQPNEFGDDASKKTCLWLRGLPPLKPTRHVAGRMVVWPKGSGKLVERWSNQTDSGQNNLGPDEDRWAERSVTYTGIAAAMAAQWG